MPTPNADVLTPREREVLGFIRLGLTNEEIAERLGITLDVAKYHVSQILSKLGVATREEAAVATAAKPLVRAPARRGWWAAWPLAAKAAGAALVVAAVAGLGVLAWGVLETSDSEGETSFDLSTCKLTIESVTKCHDQATQRPNSVYHRMGVSDNEVGDISSEGHVESWVDPTHDRERIETYDAPDEQFRFASITLGETVYLVMTESGKPPKSSTFPRSRCPESDTGLSLVAPCPGFTIRSSSSSVESGTYEGSQVVVLADEFTAETDDEVVTFSSRRTLDASSYLPLVDEVIRTSDSGPFQDTRWVTRWQSEFVDTDSLPDDFFDPASIGYVEPTPTP